MGQPVAFFEIISPDAERAQKFYGELFGWQVAADPAMGGYGLVDTGAGRVPSAAASAPVSPARKT
jgi:predicted enzyme related to lactoylglutathione lyase